MRNKTYIGSWTISCGHGLGTETASRPIHQAIGTPQPYSEIIPSAVYPHHTFEGKLSEILDVTPRLKTAVKEALLAEKDVVVIGGDHSIALGSVAGTLDYDPNAAVIWFDAHGDVNTEKTSPTGNIHGMPVAALFGWCESALSSVPTVHLKPQNIFWIGVRDLDDGEKQLAAEHGLTMYSTEDVHRLGMTEVMRHIASRLDLQGVKTLHLSFDIDGMDPSVVAATGTKVPDGLLQTDFEAFVNALKALSSDNGTQLPGVDLRVIDFVEYNPQMDSDGSTLQWCRQSLQTLLSCMK